MAGFRLLLHAKGPAAYLSAMHVRAGTGTYQIEGKLDSGTGWIGFSPPQALRKNVRPPQGGRSCSKAFTQPRGMNPWMVKFSKLRRLPFSLASKRTPPPKGIVIPMK
jgi:hypothetical protein